MKKIKDKVLWCISKDRLLDQEIRYGVKYYDGFMYSDCGHIILGAYNKEHNEFSNLFIHTSEEMMFDVRYKVGVWRSFNDSNKVLENNF